MYHISRSKEKTKNIIIDAKKTFDSVEKPLLIFLN